MKHICKFLIHLLSNFILLFVLYLKTKSFNRDLLQVPEIAADFTRYRLYFDSDYTSQDTFTVNRN
jgi:hypothetical protein